MKFEIADCHNDFLTAFKNKEQREEYIKECHNQGVVAMCCAVYTTGSAVSIKNIKDYKDELNYLSKKYAINLLLTIEDLGFVKTIQDLESLVKVKPFSVTLTWNYENQFAGGAKTDIGLTCLGRDAVALLEDNRILVDTAHLSKKAFNDLAEVTRQPIFNSHSNLYSIYPHERNLSDKQIKIIVESGGFLGVTIYDKFIAGRRITNEDVVNQFDYLIKRFGNQNFGFGTDFYGVDFSCLPLDIKNYNHLNKVADRLLKKSLSLYNVNGIMYKNFLNFLDNIKKNNA